MITPENFALMATIFLTLVIVYFVLLQRKR